LPSALADGLGHQQENGFSQTLMIMNVLSSDGRGEVYFNYAELHKTTNVIEQIH